MHFECVRNHPLSVLKNKITQRVVLVAFCVGVPLGYVSFIVGVVASFHGLQSLVQVLRYRWSFLQKLEWHAANAKRKAFITKAVVVDKKKMVDPITSEWKYKIVLKYQADKNRECESYLVIQSDEYPIATSEIVRDCPSEGFAVPLHVMDGKVVIPTELYRDRIYDLQIWAKWVDPIVSVLGIFIYLFLAFLYSELVTFSSQGFHMVMGMAILSMVLMTPYIVLDVRVRHKQRLDKLENNPLAVVTEFEKIRNLWLRLGPTLSQKLRPFLFAAGLLAMAVFSSIGIIPGCWVVWSVTKWTDAKITSQRESLLRLFQRAAKVKGYMVDCFLPEFGEHKKPSVTIRYTAPNGQKVEKKLEHENLTMKYYQHKMQNNKVSGDDSNPPSLPMDILVLLDYPCSGYPEKNIVEAWSRLKLQIISFTCLFFYLLCFTMEYDGWLPLYYDIENEVLDCLVNDMIIFWAPAFVPLMFMLPQTYSFHRNQYRRLLNDIFETGIEITSI